MVHPAVSPSLHSRAPLRRRWVLAVCFSVVLAVMLWGPTRASADDFGPWRGTVTYDRTYDYADSALVTTERDHFVYTLTGPPDSSSGFDTYPADVQYTSSSDTEYNSCGPHYLRRTTSGSTTGRVQIIQYPDQWEINPFPPDGVTIQEESANSGYNSSGVCVTFYSSRTLYDQSLATQPIYTAQQPTAGGTAFAGTETLPLSDQYSVYTGSWDLSRDAPPNWILTFSATDQAGAPLADVCFGISFYDPYQSQTLNTSRCTGQLGTNSIEFGGQIQSADVNQASVPSGCSGGLSGVQTVQAGTQTLNVQLTCATSTSRAVADFDGDGRTDVSVYRPSEGRWYVRRSSDGGLLIVDWGTSTDVPVPADYDGDGKTDVAVYRPSEGRWYIRRSSDLALQIVYWGTATDTPVPSDYDGDGKADPAVFRPGEGRWYIQRSSDGTAQFVNWGTATDVPVPADYGGSPASELVIYRPSEGRWYNNAGGFVDWGTSTDVPVPGDYGGPASQPSDLVVYRPSEGRWYFEFDSSSINWGAASDVPQPGDYTGDGKTDVAVYRPSEGRWYINGQSFVDFGTSGDIPLVLPAAIRLRYYN